jgi:hypothetical protein
MILENMPNSAWRDRITAKVQDTQNIYHALPEDFDFLIMTASFAGAVGRISMAFYSAANAYQDDFARYLNDKEKKATIIDYLAANDIGMFAVQGGASMFNRLMQPGQYTRYR